MRIARSVAGVVPVLLVIMLGIALLVPLMTPYSSAPSESDRTAEMDTVQTAMDAMMVDNEITDVVPSSYAIQDWISYPIATGLGLHPLTDYLRETTTGYFYCWDTTGRITQQEETGQVRCSQQE